MELTPNVLSSYNCVSKLLPSQLFFRHSEYKIDYTCLFVFIATNYLISHI